MRVKSFSLDLMKFYESNYFKENFGSERPIEEEVKIGFLKNGEVVIFQKFEPHLNCDRYFIIPVEDKRNCTSITYGRMYSLDYEPNELTDQNWRRATFERKGKGFCGFEIEDGWLKTWNLVNFS